MSAVFNLTFKKGLKDGLPIAIGYLSVSFAFGILAVNSGLPIWAPIVTSLTNFTGTGQFVGTTLIAASASIAEIAFTLLIINARYVLMSISLSQRLEKVSIWKKLIIAFGNTDEIFAVAVSKYCDLSFKYMTGLILCSFSGWVGGTVLGALCGSIIPQSILSAMGIALYAMFIAIIIPPAKKSRAVLLVVALGALISVAIYYIPFINQLNSSWRIIIAGVLSTLIGTFIMPLKDEPKEPPEYIESDKNQPNCIVNDEPSNGTINDKLDFNSTADIKNADYAKSKAKSAIDEVNSVNTRENVESIIAHNKTKNDVSCDKIEVNTPNAENGDNAKSEGKTTPDKVEVRYE